MKINASDEGSIGEQLFKHQARFECERSSAPRKFIWCGKPATKVIEWRHQDGDREVRAVCDEHAIKEQKYWSGMDWDTGLKVSSIEEWQLSVFHSGRTATRVGSRFKETKPKRNG